jgi:hypothetical protein
LVSIFRGGTLIEIAIPIGERPAAN